jgi:hypothetical protein
MPVMATSKSPAILVGRPGVKDEFDDASPAASATNETAIS